MSPDEAKRLLAMAGNLKVHVLLALGYGAGLRAGEVVRLRVGDIDSAQNIPDAKGGAGAWPLRSRRDTREARNVTARRDDQIDVTRNVVGSQCCLEVKRRAERCTGLGQ